MRILIADDHAVLREGLRLLLDGTEGLEVVGEAADGEEALRQAEELRPDIVLLDLAMPRMGGLEAARRLREILPGAKVVILTVHDQEQFVFQALQAGASGYLLKESGSAEILSAMRAVAAGGCYLSPRISRTVIQDYLRQEQKRPRGAQAGSLSERECEVLRLIAEGSSNRQIAAQIHLSPKTVENHRANIMRKLGVHNRVALVKAALKLGLISVEMLEASPPASK